jgi:hypothetical protein
VGIRTYRPLLFIGLAWVWHVTFGPGRWSVTCGVGGLAMAVEERGAGRSGWEWTQDGQPAPPAAMPGAKAERRRRRAGSKPAV